jgi:hypothetical protein
MGIIIPTFLGYWGQVRIIELKFGSVLPTTLYIGLLIDTCRRGQSYGEYSRAVLEQRLTNTKNRDRRHWQKSIK